MIQPNGQEDQFPMMPLSPLSPYMNPDSARNNSKEAFFSCQGSDATTKDVPTHFLFTEVMKEEDKECLAEPDDDLTTLKQQEAKLQQALSLVTGKILKLQAALNKASNSKI